MVLAVLLGEPMAAARGDRAAAVLVASPGVGGGCPKLVRLGVAVAPRSQSEELGGVGPGEAMAGSDP